MNFAGSLWVVMVGLLLTGGTAVDAALRCKPTDSPPLPGGYNPVDLPDAQGTELARLARNQFLKTGPGAANCRKATKHSLKAFSRVAVDAACMQVVAGFFWEIAFTAKIGCINPRTMKLQTKVFVPIEWETSNRVRSEVLRSSSDAPCRTAGSVIAGPSECQAE
eukprot:CAMPEP_0206145878 /NCGR_PEP_ID=MMETSP1473-20131121/28752_1 /ASSEMBLY_ACC=CAM_ASM_001109 /TAXON_ID=1461547 /ORGANISM="Stichococcus sp, Strain RCC1054" /LENGTH=163 /DNA_ID=CAMNT_0053542257 /DNA_START=72 /DNA_END=563 /DNA_ORIENTATION=+